MTGVSDQRWRAKDLATHLPWSPSRLSHHVDRMQRRELTNTPLEDPASIFSPMLAVEHTPQRKGSRTPTDFLRPGASPPAGGFWSLPSVGNAHADGEKQVGIDALFTGSDHDR